MGALIKDENLRSLADALWALLYAAYETGEADLDKQENFKEFYNLCHQIIIGYNDDGTKKKLIQS